MICLRCGYCCLMYDVVIVSDPDKPADDENNIEFKQNNQRCKHLVGDKIGEFSCVIHNKDWYDTTPCYQFTQFEVKNSPCRMGEYQIKKLEKKNVG